jgi:hypothetical protein
MPAVEVLLEVSHSGDEYHKRRHCIHFAAVMSMPRSMANQDRPHTISSVHDIANQATLTERRVRVSAPGVHAGGLDGHHGRARGEHRALVLRALLLEQVHAGHGDHAQPHTVARAGRDVSEGCELKRKGVMCQSVRGRAKDNRKYAMWILQPALAVKDTRTGK